MPNTPIPRREWHIASGAERAFAASMVRRALHAFADFVADDAVFINGGLVIARFYSTWQLQPSGPWCVVFDNGCAECKR